MAEITRRQVSKGAAWAVPVLAVGAAAPAMAASACPTITVLGAVQAGAGSQWRVDFTLSDFTTGADTYSGTVDVVQHNTNSGVEDSRQGLFSEPYDGITPVLPIQVLTSRTGPSYVVSVTVTITSPVSCTYTEIFPTP